MEKQLERVTRPGQLSQHDLMQIQQKGLGKESRSKGAAKALSRDEIARA
jgi:hypothetical protein